MITLRKNAVTLYVDRSSKQWIALDAEGSFWVVSSVDENPWDGRQPFYPTVQTDLEPVPGHYRHMLCLPTCARSASK